MVRTETGKYLDSDGNRVNVGNFDSKGLNVNNNSDDNYNDNLSLAAARNCTLALVTKKYPDYVGTSCYSLVDFIQPLSIRPISSTFVCRTTYFLLSIAFTSFASRKKTRAILSLRLTCSRVEYFAFFGS